MSFVFNAWIAFGAYAAKPEKRTLSRSTAGCRAALNETSYDKHYYLQANNMSIFSTEGQNTTSLVITENRYLFLTIYNNKISFKKFKFWFIFKFFNTLKKYTIHTIWTPVTEKIFERILIEICSYIQEFTKPPLAVITAPTFRNILSTSSYMTNVILFT